MLTGHAMTIVWQAPSRPPIVFLATLLLGQLVLAPAGAEEAILRDGRRVPGTLQLAKTGGLNFRAAGGGQVLRLDQIHDVRFPAAAAPSCLGSMIHHVEQADGQRLTAELLGLDAKELRLRTPWAKAVALPRPLVRSVMQPRGLLTFMEDDFESDLQAWKLTGTPALNRTEHRSGEQSLLLDRPGQAAEFRLAQPLPAGRVGISFFDTGKHRGRQWQVDFAFQRGAEAQFLRVLVGGEATYRVESPGPADESARLARRNGWHRLAVEFDREAALVAVDHDVLWSGRLGAGFALTKVRLACGATQGQGLGEGVAFFDDFTLARAVEDLRHERADPSQDEVWLRCGDQLLGSVVRADRRAVELEARYGKHRLSWGEVRGFFLRQGYEPKPRPETNRVRVWFQACQGAEPDQLVGQVSGLSEQHLTLRHAQLGELVLDRAWLRRIAAAE
jgi:hypothetical protein